MSRGFLLTPYVTWAGGFFSVPRSPHLQEGDTPRTSFLVLSGGLSE